MPSLKTESCIYQKLLWGGPQNLGAPKSEHVIGLNECLVCELKVNNTKCFITVLYRSTSQSIETFHDFKKGLEQTIININKNNPYVTALVGDFNARNKNLWGGHINNVPCLVLDEVSSHCRLTQLIPKKRTRNRVKRMFSLRTKGQQYKMFHNSFISIYQSIN